MCVCVCVSDVCVCVSDVCVSDVCVYLTCVCACMCVCVWSSGEYLLFCKGADSSIFPRVVCGKVEQVKARVEQNAVVSGRLGFF